MSKCALGDPEFRSDSGDSAFSRFVQFLNASKQITRHYLKSNVSDWCATVRPHEETQNYGLPGLRGTQAESNQ
jgi:hypothetical protein